MSLITGAQLTDTLARVAARDVPENVYIDSTMEASYPVFDTASRKLYPGVALVGRVAQGANTHTVVLAACRADDGFKVHLGCGDKFFDCAHGLEPKEARRRCSVVVPQSSPEAQQEMLDGHAIFPSSDACDFFIKFRANHELCDHTACFLQDLSQRFPELLRHLEQRLTAFEEQLEAAGTEDDGLGVAYFAFKTPVLLLGERGSGKTMLSRGLADNDGLPYFELAGHAEVDATDMLGMLVPYGQGQLVWKDGPVSAAFRSAAAGRTVLAFDELLRIDQRQLSFLLTTLSPSQGRYHLRTGRVMDVVDGVAREEVLTCPCENLCVIASSNIGADYAVVELEPALADRFVVLEYNATKSLVRKYVRSACKERQFGSIVADGLVAAYAALTALKKAGSLRYAPSARMMVNAVRLAPDEARVPVVLKKLCTQLAVREMDGAPSKTQLEDIALVLTRCFEPS